MIQQNTATETSSAAELAELRDSVRDFLAAKSGEQRVRAAIETERGYDEDLWRQMAEQLSLPGLALPEEYGGDGFGFTELQVVLEELGRALTPSPFLASVVLAAGAILATGDEAAAKAHLPGIASGKITATLAVAESSGLWSLDELTTTARSADDASTRRRHRRRRELAADGDEAVRDRRRDGRPDHRRRAHRSGRRLLRRPARPPLRRDCQRYR